MELLIGKNEKEFQGALADLVTRLDFLLNTLRQKYNFNEISPNILIISCHFHREKANYVFNYLSTAEQSHTSAM